MSGIYIDNKRIKRPHNKKLQKSMLIVYCARLNNNKKSTCYWLYNILVTFPFVCHLSDVLSHWETPYTFILDCMLLKLPMKKWLTTAPVPDYFLNNDCVYGHMYTLRLF